MGSLFLPSPPSFAAPPVSPEPNARGQRSLLLDVRALPSLFAPPSMFPAGGRTCAYECGRAGPGRSLASTVGGRRSLSRLAAAVRRLFAPTVVAAARIRSALEPPPPAAHRAPEADPATRPPPSRPCPRPAGRSESRPVSTRLCRAAAACQGTWIPAPAGGSTEADARQLPQLWWRHGRRAAGAGGATRVAAAPSPSHTVKRAAASAVAATPPPLTLDAAPPSAICGPCGFCGGGGGGGGSDAGGWGDGGGGGSWGRCELGRKLPVESEWTGLAGDFVTAASVTTVGALWAIHGGAMREIIAAGRCATQAHLPAAGCRRPARPNSRGARESAAGAAWRDPAPWSGDSPCDCDPDLPWLERPGPTDSDAAQTAPRATAT